MGIQTIVAVAMIVLSVVSAMSVFANNLNARSFRNVSLIKEIGLFAFIIGLLGSVLDLMGMFQAIEMAGDIHPGLMAAGLKITFIPPTYGLMIYALSLLIYFVLCSKANAVTSE